MTVSDPAPDLTPAPLKRRDRLRAATTAEILETARRLLLEAGPQGISLRAIAREMGMTAPGLYRYFDDREELVRRLIADIFDELHDEIEGAIHADAIPPDADPAERITHLTNKMMAACRAFRSWALAHPGEFGLVFGVVPGNPDPTRDEILANCATRFASTFFTLFVQLYEQVRFPVPADDEIDPTLREQLKGHAEMKFPVGEVPAGAHVVFLQAWTQLYGAVALEVLGHLAFALEDPAPMFEYTLAGLARLVGLNYPS